MRTLLWWAISGLMLVVFLPIGIILLAMTMIIEISNMFETSKQKSYSDGELEDFKIYCLDIKHSL